MDLNTENLNYLLDYVLPLEQEIAFYREMTELFPNILAVSGTDAQSYLRTSRGIIKCGLADQSRASLQYALAATSRERAAALMEPLAGEIVQKVFDIRMAIIKELPELELIFTERL